MSPKLQEIKKQRDQEMKTILEGKEELIKKVVELKIVSEHMWYLKGETK